MQSVGIAHVLFLEAQSAHSLLSQHLGPLHAVVDVPSAGHSSSDEHEQGALVLAAGNDIPHGLLPEALSLMLGGRIFLHSASADIQVG